MKGRRVENSKNGCAVRTAKNTVSAFVSGVCIGNVNPCGDSVLGSRSASRVFQACRTLIPNEK